MVLSLVNKYTYIPNLELNYYILEKAHRKACRVYRRYVRNFFEIIFYLYFNNKTIGYIVNVENIQNQRHVSLPIFVTPVCPYNEFAYRSTRGATIYSVLPLRVVYTIKWHRWDAKPHLKFKYLAVRIQKFTGLRIPFQSISIQHIG